MSLKRDSGKIAHNGNSDAAIEESRLPGSLESDNNGTDGKEELVATLAKLDAERHALVQSTIEQLNAGAAVDKNTYRRIRAIDTHKNRLLVARFTSLLRENGSHIKQLVERLLQI
ncbi:hypothetical protein [Paraburkholderia caledonica]|uniref:Uncharacterized protein n=1 Tax=Paraburkholderia caledonica TaxID=134536 RepID=A0ABU1KT84_9BURK|nr:hypothetical protein [Paraburkholderia caledonica]MDR6374165.1 hypothetical protein [Paraburkholderia caledonica]